jgi:transcriptional regulator with XRE-family HTH domain
MSTTVQDLRQRRVLARIPGHVLCRLAGLHRSRLSDIERGTVSPSPNEIERIERALTQLIAVRKKVSEFANECGWPSALL